MNLTNEVTITIDGEDETIKLTNLALHKSVKGLKLQGVVPLLSGIEQLDLEVLFTLLKHGIKSKKTVESLMDCEVNLQDLATALGEALVSALGIKADSDQ